ncbi:MAG: hypothetical protein MZW92_32650 [Comamonadaceae bacterium]|nr:hypothetical protein [Comamonadaceae bacterium]
MHRQATTLSHQPWAPIPSLAGTTNDITGGTGNSITAITGDNTMTATAGGNAINGFVNNTITATTGDSSITATAGNNTISAMGTDGTNNLTANATNGTNNIEARYNNIGVTTANSINVIGSTSTGTTVDVRGGTGSLSVVNNSTRMGVTDGSSIITAASTTTTGEIIAVNRGVAEQHATINNGVIMMDDGTAEEGSVSMTMTNGLGNTHGVAITENQTVISGGAHSTSLTFERRWRDFP